MLCQVEVIPLLSFTFVYFLKKYPKSVELGDQLVSGQVEASERKIASKTVATRCKESNTTRRVVDCASRSEAQS